MCALRGMHWATLLIACALTCVEAYYIPGAYPREFKVGDEVQVEVNSLSSFDTEMPEDYYSLPFCKPEGGVKRSTSSVNPGTILSGLRMFSSPYTFKVNVEEKGKSACPKGSAGALTKKQLKKFKDMIKNNYRIRMVLDNMPVTTFDLSLGPVHLKPGFELGVSEEGKDGKDDYYVFNHLVFNVLVHQTHGEYTRAQQGAYSSLSLDTTGRRMLAWPEGTPQPIVDALKARSARTLSQTEDVTVAPKADDTETWMVVGFEVMPCSVRREFGDAVTPVSCKPWGAADNPEPQSLHDGADIIYTYDVYWEPSAVEWASRWDAYLRMPNGSVHWFSILNSLLVVLVMSVIVAVILMRTVRLDLAKYEELLVDGAEGKEESGWKLVSGDVFRSPACPAELAVQVGSGVQILCAAIVTLLLAAAGFLSPASRGALLTSAIVLYLLLAVTAGYAAVLVWTNLQRSPTGWTGVCLKTACYFPGITMLVLTLLNILLEFSPSHGAIPLTMYFSLVAIWFLVSIPLTYVGGYAAFRTPLLTWPTRTNQIPRHVPPPPTAADPYLLYAAAGILPFCTVFIELYFAMTSMWQGYFYYLFGFLFIVGALTVLITIEVAILCTYVQLCAEDYHWWWRSLHRGGAVAAYLLVYAFIFLWNNLPAMHGLSIALYLAYMAVCVLAVHLAMGAVGFGSSLLFVRTIFAAVKAD